MTRTPDLLWRELHWQRPLGLDGPLSAIRACAADAASPTIVLEARATAGRVRFLLGATRRGLSPTLARLRTSVPDIQITEPGDDDQRQPVRRAARLQLSTRHRALRSDKPELTVRQLLGALAVTGSKDQLVLQLVIGPRRIPLAVPNNSPSSIVRPWYGVAWHGNGGTVDPEKRTALRTKVADHGFAATVRVGASAPTGERADRLISGVLAAIRTSETPGLQVRLVPDRPANLHRVWLPGIGLGGVGWPLRLNVSEAIALTAWPIGEGDLPGLPALHPKQVPPVRLARPGERIVADAWAPGVSGQLGYSVMDAMRHTWALGPTGTGKSTFLLNLIAQDLEAGRAVVVIEPNDLVADVLARVPAHRRDDIVVLDPTDDSPVGINPLVRHGRRPELVADSLLGSFQALYGGSQGARGEALGPRSTDILSNCLQVLAQHGDDGDTSLVMLPLLLTNPGFRRSLTCRVIERDPIGAGPFWSWFESLSDDARSQVVAPLANKLRPLIRPQLRAVLGQRRPKFNIRDVLQQRKVLLVPLQPGVIGPDSAELLGALVVSELWLALRERRSIPEAARTPVMIYVDEVQSYLRTPVDLADALATSRSLRAGWHLSHQFVGQLSSGMRAAFETNARSRVCFQLEAADARFMAAGQSVIAPDDFGELPAFHVYASLMQDGARTPWASGRTRQAPPVCSDPDDIRRRSRERYGQPLDRIEADFAEILNTSTSAGDTTATPGRRRRAAP